MLNKPINPLRRFFGVSDEQIHKAKHLQDSWEIKCHWNARTNAVNMDMVSFKNSKMVERQRRAAAQIVR